MTGSASLPWPVEGLPVLARGAALSTRLSPLKGFKPQEAGYKPLLGVPGCPTLRALQACDDADVLLVVDPEEPGARLLMRRRLDPDELRARAEALGVATIGDIELSAASLRIPLCGRLTLPDEPFRARRLMPRRPALLGVGGSLLDVTIGAGRFSDEHDAKIWLEGFRGRPHVTANGRARANMFLADHADRPVIPQGSQGAAVVAAEVLTLLGWLEAYPEAVGVRPDPEFADPNSRPLGRLTSFADGALALEWRSILDDSLHVVPLQRP